MLGEKKKHPRDGNATSRNLFHRAPATSQTTLQAEAEAHVVVSVVVGTAPWEGRLKWANPRPSAYILISLLDGGQTCGLLWIPLFLLPMLPR